MKAGRKKLPKDLKKSVTHHVKVPVQYDKDLRQFIKINKYPSMSEFYYMIGQEKLKQVVQETL